MELRIGRADENVLQRSVYKRIEMAGVPPLFGNASFGSAAHPSALRTRWSGRLAVIHALNDLAARGVRPAAVETVLLLPPGTQEETLRALVDQIAQECAAQGVALTGGHTEVTGAVTRPVVVASAAGDNAIEVTGAVTERAAESEAAADGGAAASEAASTGGTAAAKRTERAEMRGAAGERTAHQKAAPRAAFSGCDLLCTKWIGLEGTFLLAEEDGERLAYRFPQALLGEARACGGQLSVLPEAAAAAGADALLLQNVAEGGIFAALWRLAQRTKGGLDVDIKAVPIRQTTVELANFYDINPYQMASAGCLLIAAPDGAAMAATLERAGVPAAVIGRCTAGRDKLLRNGDEARFLDRPQPEALLGVEALR